MKYLITGGCGFVGCNLAKEVLRNKGDLFILDNLSRQGSEQNLKWLQSQGQFKFYQNDISDEEVVKKIIKKIQPDVIFHLSGQVAMTTSINNPSLDFKINTIGTLNILEAVRLFSPHSSILYSSTNKVYGDFKQFTFDENETRYLCKEYPNGFNEDIPLSFHSPYGCSKGAADQYLLDYNRIFGLKTAVFRHSTMYGGRQYATFDQGWIAWFCQKAIEIKRKLNQSNFTISGNGKQVRDLLHKNDIVELYFKAAKNIDKIQGQAFNIGGGEKNSLSLLELFTFLENHLDIDMKFDIIDWRESDQKVFIADLEKIHRMLSWSPKVSYQDGLADLLDWTDEMYEQ